MNTGAQTEPLPGSEKNNNYQVFIKTHATVRSLGGDSYLIPVK